MENFSHLGWVLPRFITEIVTAIICGGLISLERAMRQKSILFRDNILVCIGVVLVLITGELISTNSVKENIPIETAPGEQYMIINHIANQDTTDAIQQPPPPIPEHSEIIVTGIIIGISLLGLGVVVRKNIEKNNLIDQGGFADAVTIWVVAAIGLIIGTGNPLLGLLMTSLTLLILIIATGMERYFRKKPRPLLLKLTIREDTPELRNILQDILNRHDIKADSFRSEKVPHGVRLTIQAPEEPQNLREMTTHLWTMKGVTEVEH
ncbi:MgtC/SapB family protein [bacterium]|nr:MgtC/SapB family protein [bacterium]